MKAARPVIPTWSGGAGQPATSGSRLPNRRGGARAERRRNMVRNLSRRVRVDMKVRLVMNLLSLRMWKVLVRLEEGSPRLTVPAMFHYPHTDHKHWRFQTDRTDKKLRKTTKNIFRNLMTYSKVLTGVLTKCG